MRTSGSFAVAGLLLLAGCGGGSSETQTVTVQQTVSAAPVTTTVEAQPVPEPTSEATTEAVEDEGSIEVPNVVGMDHQLAQDTMQASGLYYLDEEDATGEGRMLLFDRNWTVVEQRPAAGTMVGADQRILLRSKKDDE
jgi:hypothetical protein